MLLVSKEDFKNWLRNEGYKEWSDNGNETTISSYIYWIERVMKQENIDTLSELTEKIQMLLRKYGKYGEMKNFGEIGHATVINSLKRFMDYLINEKNFIPNKELYFK